MASVWARYLAEFLGTYILVIVIACNAIVSNNAWLPTYVAGAVTALTYSLYNVSGAHLNPAVSIAFGVAGKMSWKMVGVYLALQFTAAVLGATTFALTLQFSLQTSKSGDYSWEDVAIVEVLFSAMFCFVFLNVASAKTKKDRQHYGLAVGLSLLAAMCASGHITGSVLNPAITMGWSIAGTHWHGVSALALGPVFVLLDLIGATVGAVLFKACHHNDEEVQTEHTMAHRVVAEAVGTFYLVFIVSLSRVSDVGTLGAAEPLIALVAVLSSMTFALRDISGASFNPAVTLAGMTSSLAGVTSSLSGALLGGDEGLVIIVVQLVAGGLGAVVATIVEHGRAFPSLWGPGFAWLAIAIAEALFTMFLAFVTLSTFVGTTPEEGAMPLSSIFARVPEEGVDRAYDGDFDRVPAYSFPGQSDYAGLAVGAAAAAGYLAVGSISGALLNPALAFGMAVMHGADRFWQSLVYIGFEFVGGALGAQLFKVLQAPVSSRKMQSYAAI